MVVVVVVVVISISLAVMRIASHVLHSRLVEKDRMLSFNHFQPTQGSTNTRRKTPREKGFEDPRETVKELEEECRSQRHTPIHRGGVRFPRVVLVSSAFCAAN